MRVHHTLASLLIGALVIQAAIVTAKTERKLADANYVKQQKQILKLYIGPKQGEYFKSEFSDFNVEENKGQWTKPEVVDSFLHMHKNYDFPRNGVFTMYNQKIRWYAQALFDLFYFAKDFDTFYKSASWAKKHFEPVLFNYAFTSALYHRADTQQFYVPPMYEVFPDYFVPQETIQEIYKSRLIGNKEGVFTYNNTGYEHNYNTQAFGGAMDTTTNQHMEFKISYFREDVGLNNYYLTWFRKYPTFMSGAKYGKSWFRQGEGFYYAHQQLLARYVLERLSNGLPFMDLFQWDKPISVGYNPRVNHHGGQPFIPRPDDAVANNVYVKEAKIMQDRIIDAIAEGGYYHTNNDTFSKFSEDDGIDELGQMIYGSKDYSSRRYYGSLFFKALQALGNIAQYQNNHQMNTGVMTCPFTALRDPVYYNFLARLVYIMKLLKTQLPAYTKKDLGFPGVNIKYVEVDKMVTYFEMYKYNVFNAVPVADNREYKALKYYARQLRLNHKPYSYKVIVESDEPHEGIVRVFIGPKYDATEHTLTLTQKGLAMFEIDRFPVNITAGRNVFERNSNESPIFSPEMDSVRDMYGKLANAATNTRQMYYYPEGVSCGLPERFQLPRGWKNGYPLTFAVVVSPITRRFEGESSAFHLTCDFPKPYDYRPLGFPFDRPVQESEFEIPNIFTKDISVYHNDEVVER